MDDASLDRVLREAPLPGLGEGHTARLHARLDARARGSRTRWRAAAAMVVLASGLTPQDYPPQARCLTSLREVPLDGLA